MSIDHLKVELIQWISLTDDVQRLYGMVEAIRPKLTDKTEPKRPVPILTPLKLVSAPSYTELVAAQGKGSVTFAEIHTPGQEDEHEYSTEEMLAAL